MCGRNSCKEQRRGRTALPALGPAFGVVVWLRLTNLSKPPGGAVNDAVGQRRQAGEERGRQVEAVGAGAAGAAVADEGIDRLAARGNLDLLVAHALRHLARGQRHDGLRVGVHRAAVAGANVRAVVRQVRRVDVGGIDRGAARVAAGRRGGRRCAGLDCRRRRSNVSGRGRGRARDNRDKSGWGDVGGGRSRRCRKRSGRRHNSGRGSGRRLGSARDDGFLGRGSSGNFLSGCGSGWDGFSRVDVDGGRLVGRLNDNVRLSDPDHVALVLVQLGVLAVGSGGSSREEGESNNSGGLHVD